MGAGRVAGRREQAAAVAAPAVASGHGQGQMPQRAPIRSSGRVRGPSRSAKSQPPRSTVAGSGRAVACGAAPPSRCSDRSCAALHGVRHTLPPCGAAVAVRRRARAYNEAAQHRRHASPRCRDCLERDGRPWELIVVDNAVTDGTAAPVRPPRRASASGCCATTVNRGKGFSVRRGMLAARGELRLHCDADCAPSLASLPRCSTLIERAPTSCGLAARRRRRRRPRASRCGGGSSGARSSQLCRLVLREPTRDLFCGFKLWRAEARRATSSRASRLDGWVFDAEALAMARALGYRIARDRHRVERPRRLAALDAARPRARRARAARGARHVARRGRARAPAAAERSPTGRRRAARATPRARSPVLALGAAVALRRSPSRRSPGCCCASGRRAGSSPAATASWCSTSCSTSTGCGRRASTALIGNLYDLAPGPRTFLHPACWSRARCTRSGSAWSPRTWSGSRSRASRCSPARWRWCRRFLARRGDRRLALVARAVLRLAVAALVGWSGLGGNAPKFEFDFLAGELMAGQLAVGLPVHGDRGGAACRSALLAYERGARPACGGAAAPGLLVARGCSRGRARRSRSCCSAPRRCCGGAAAGAPVAPRGGSRRRSRDRRAARLLPRAVADRRRLGARRTGQRLRARWPLVGHGRRAGAARRCRRCSPTARGRATSAQLALRAVAARRAGRLLPAGRDVPRPRVPGHDAAARRCSRVLGVRARLGVRPLPLAGALPLASC